jgi:hypothetical protein
MKVAWVHRSARRLLPIALLAMLAALLVIPHAASQETQTVDVDVVRIVESIERVRAVGNESLDRAALGRGDVLSGQAAVYAAGDAGGERIGTYYFSAIGTADPAHFATAANHAYVSGYFELFNRGTLAVSGVISFRAPSAIAITGGTGSFATTSGQCTLTPVEGGDHWECHLN